MVYGRKKVGMSRWKFIIRGPRSKATVIDNERPRIETQTFLALRIELPSVFPSWRAIDGIELR
jgi:hypothetical protein